jgi:hypothetical protein
MSCRVDVTCCQPLRHRRYFCLMLQLELLFCSQLYQSQHQQPERMSAHTAPVTRPSVAVHRQRREPASCRGLLPVSPAPQRAPPPPAAAAAPSPPVPLPGSSPHPAHPTPEHQYNGTSAHQQSTQRSQRAKNTKQAKSLARCNQLGACVTVVPGPHSSPPAASAPLASRRPQRAAVPLALLPHQRVIAISPQPQRQHRASLPPTPVAPTASRTPQHCIAHHSTAHHTTQHNHHHNNNNSSSSSNNNNNNNQKRASARVIHSDALTHTCSAINARCVFSSSCVVASTCVLISSTIAAAAASAAAVAPASELGDTARCSRRCCSASRCCSSCEVSEEQDTRAEHTRHAYASSARHTWERVACSVLRHWRTALHSP